MTGEHRTLLAGILLGSVMLTCVVGCDMQSVPSAPRADKPQPPQPPPPVTHEALPPPPAHAPAPPPQQERAGAGSYAAPPPQERLPTTPSAGSPPKFFARLSAGVALPQLLPTGTAMGMSVDYVLQDTLPTSTMQVVWVIESAQGPRGEVPVQLKSQGNLMTFATDMKPEHGPFASYLAIVLADGSKVPISPKIDMASP